MSSELAREPLPLPTTGPLPVPDTFAAAALAMGYTGSAAQTETLAAYLAALLAMNEQMNLTAITTPDEAWSRHALDAFSLLPHLAQLPAGSHVLDVGSGGGLPGIPIAIARPDLRITLLEATQKKAGFLSAVCKKLALDNVSVVSERAEDLQDSEFTRAFDVVTARAVARISKLLGFTVPFVKPKGRLLFIKGQRADEELAEAKGALRRFRCTHLRTVVGPTGRVVELQVG
jgi:16S rRNA (guanine527-N7)-methyltransferase